MLPQVNIVALDDSETTFLSGAKLEYFVDETVVNTGFFNATNDFCLARANSSNMWECESRTLTELRDGFWSYPIT